MSPQEKSACQAVNQTFNDCLSEIRGQPLRLQRRNKKDDLQIKENRALALLLLERKYDAAKITDFVEWVLCQEIREDVEAGCWPLEIAKLELVERYEAILQEEAEEGEESYYPLLVRLYLGLLAEQKCNGVLVAKHKRYLRDGASKMKEMGFTPGQVERFFDWVKNTVHLAKVGRVTLDYTTPWLLTGSFSMQQFLDNDTEIAKVDLEATANQRLAKHLNSKYDLEARYASQNNPRLVPTFISLVSENVAGWIRKMNSATAVVPLQLSLPPLTPGEAQSRMELGEEDLVELKKVYDGRDLSVLH